MNVHPTNCHRLKDEEHAPREVCVCVGVAADLAQEIVQSDLLRKDRFRPGRFAIEDRCGLGDRRACPFALSVSE